MNRSHTIVIILLMALSLTAGGCIFKTQKVAVPPQNKALESRIQNKLKNDPLTAPWEIRPHVDGATVTLTGLVDQEKERQRAEELARSVVGEFRKVNNQLLLTIEVILDNSIVAKLKTDLITDPTTRMATIDVKSYKGVVTLNGEVVSAEQKREAERLAQSIAGVRQIENRLKVQG
ncbi:MAG: BON domain-containing protein [Nitrospirae bacterium]|nr:BON domain-containing protein [Candidatus Manganitrophaceae bacterium]